MTLDNGDEAVRDASVERVFRSLWETTPDAVLLLDPSKIIRYANPGATSLFGHAQAELQGSPLALVQPDRLLDDHLRAMSIDVDADREGRNLEWRVIETKGLHADGHEIPVELHMSRMAVDGGILLVCFVRDISARLATTDALERERERVRGTLRCIGDGVLTIDADGCVTTINPVAERLTGWSAEQALGQPCNAVLRLTDERTRQPIPLCLSAAGEGVEALPLPGGAVLHPHAGPKLPIEGSIARLGSSDDAGHGAGHGWVIALRDVSQSRRLMALLAYQASHDALTGLVNRSEFDRRLCRAVEAANDGKRHASLLYLDLDQFKIVNDTCGHQAGDAMLTQLASILLHSVRSGDTLARLGGDEFGVLLEDCSAVQALEIGETLRATISKFVFVWKGQPFSGSASIGHVHFDDAARHADELLSRADEACYVAKDLGRNRIHTYRPGEEAQAHYHREMQWVGQIHRAFDEDRFVLYSQPIFSITHAGRPATHHEVLLRMRDEAGVLVPPMAFLPAAERYNLMPRLDRWVVSTVLAAVAAVHEDPARCTTTFAINLSGSTLSDPDFAAFLLEELEGSGLSGSCVTFEITETAAIANLASAVRLIEAMRGVGCRFALDDFGSGLSSFAYLKHLPVEFLKIDGSFVKGVVNDPVDRAMVASIHQIGKLMGLCTIAECVEDDAILQELRVIGVDYAQGYGMQRPQPLEDCLASLRATHST